MDVAPASLVDFAAGIGPAVVHETHTGIVVLVGDRAYKAKKPVVNDFLDFSTRQARERVCQREVALNRRLAPTCYLGVAHLDGPADQQSEPVIVMRRQPDSQRLALMVTDGRPVTGHLDRIAEVLVCFHREAERGDAIDASATAEAVAARWQENLAELRGRPCSHGAFMSVGSSTVVSIGSDRVVAAAEQRILLESVRRRSDNEEERAHHG